VNLETTARDWETDLEVALRVLARRWEKEVSDLVSASLGERLAFDDLDLDDDLDEITRAVGQEKLARLARRGLAAGAPEREDDPAIRALGGDTGTARAFLRLMAANLAFVLRTDELLQLLARSAKEGAPPRISPADVGALLSRARSARWARNFLSGLFSLSEKEREEALASVKPSARKGDFSVLHARTSPEEVGAALSRLLKRDRKLVSAPWGTRKTRDQDSVDERYVVTERRGGWSTLVAPGGVSRELATTLSQAPFLGRVAWAASEGGAHHFSVLESGRTIDDDARLAASLGALEPDDVSGALRALGIVAHDELAPGEPTPLVFEEYVAPGKSSSPSRLRRMRAQGFAFSLARK